MTDFGYARWAYRKMHLSDLVFFQRRVAQPKVNKVEGLFIDMLVFEGHLSNHEVGDPVTLLIGDKVRIRVEIVRMHRDNSKSVVRGSAQERGLELAYSDTADEGDDWDTSLDFVLMDGVSDWQGSIRTYAQPEVFDRFITMDLSACTANLTVEYALSMHSEERGSLPGLGTDWRERHRASTGGRLDHLSVVKKAAPIT